MTFNSIRVRLLLAAALMIIMALLAAAVSISFVFQQHLERRVRSELDKHLTQLIANLEVRPDGTLSLTKELADPRFSLPFSGLYWQVDLDGGPVAKSRSLWDEKLVVPTPPTKSEDEHVHELGGPAGQQIYAIERGVMLEHGGKDRLFVVTLGLERGEISDTVLSMTRDVVPALAVLGFVLFLATWLQLSLGLKPLFAIGRAVQAVRDGSMSRFDETVAEEVKPLVSELNILLSANENRNRAARQRAADLAHGLRTPLAVLGSVSRSLGDKGLEEEAEKISVQTEHMRQQVERELARTMSSVEDAPSWLDVKENVARLVKVVGMGVRDTPHQWAVNVPDDLQWLITRNDFNEIFGNLLENAQKWGKTRAEVTIEGPMATIADDGPGVAEDVFSKLTERGYSNGGSGLGLAIVQQICTQHQIELKFARSRLGGLSACLKLPPQMFRSKPLRPRNVRLREGDGGARPAPSSA